MKSESAARLRVLLLEDNPADAELVLYELQRAGIDAETVRVVTREDFEARLDPCPDVILSDYHLPLWDGLLALRLVRERGLEIPFIIVSGTIGEDLAVEMMRHGADDYLLKDRLSRLGASVTQALGRKRLERERTLAERELERVKARYQLIFDHAAAGIILSTIKGGILAINPAGAAMLGYGSPDEVVAAVTDISTQLYADPQERNAVRERMDRDGQVRDFALQYKRKDGSTLTVSQTSRVLEEGYEGRKLAISIVQDMTERKQAEETLREQRARLAGLIDSAMDAVVTVDSAQRITLFNPAAERMFGFPSTQMNGQPLDRLIPERHRARHSEHISDFGQTAVSSRQAGNLGAVTGLRANGEEFSLETSISQIEVGGQKYYTAILRDITERHRAAQALAESERRFSSMLGNVDLISMMLDREARITYCNDYLLRLTGWKREEVLGRDWFELFISPGIDDLKDVFAALLEDQPVAWHHENEILTRSGERRLIRWNNSVLRSVSGDVIGTASIGEDITERNEQERRIARLSRIQAVLSGINSAIVRIRDRQELLNEACRIAEMHGAFRMAWFGLRNQATGEMDVVASAGFDAGFFEKLPHASPKEAFGPRGVGTRALHEGRTFIDNDIIANPDINVIRRAAVDRGCRSVIDLPLSVEGVTVGSFILYAEEKDFFDEGEVKLLEELAGDISFGLEFIAKEEKVDYLAYYDALTGLPNRTLLLDRLGQYLHAAQREHRMAAVIFVDLERFHVINDTLGRSAGDTFLKEIARRLQEHVRAEDTIARVGADCFAVALTNVGSTAEVVHLLQNRVSAFLKQPIALAGQELRVSARSGAAMYPSDGDSPETLYANAEAALKKAKVTGERIMFYAPEMNARIAESLMLENKLRNALEKEQFVLFYQPKVTVGDRRITGLEALMRWKEPELGLVPPAKFIPLMEETGLILDAGRWALSQVARDCRLWSASGIKPPRVAVNVSPLQLRQKDFVDAVVEAAEKTQEADGMLDLEITESVIMENVETIIPKLQTIRELGVEIAVDDFGTGYSSLTYIARLPIQDLKIDRSFVVGMTQSEDSLAIVKSVISLAHSLRLNVVAEGVETEEQAAMLLELGCDEMQGYLLSPPVPPEEVPALVRKLW